MRETNLETIRIFKALYEKFPAGKEFDIRKSNLSKEKIEGLLRFLSEEGYIRVSGSSPTFYLSLTEKGYKFIHSFLKRTNNHNELLIIYQEV